MKDLENNINDRLEFSGPATYKIVLKGTVPASWADNFGDLKLTSKQKDGQHRSILEGKILDQAQLSGILNAIYELHLSVIEVTLIDN